MGKVKVELNLPSKAKAVFKKQHSTRKPLQLIERVQHIVDILTHFNISAHVNTDSLGKGNTFINPVIVLKNKQSLNIVLDARKLNTMIEKTEPSWPIEPIQVIFTQIKGPVYSLEDMNNAFRQQFCFRRRKDLNLT